MEWTSLLHSSRGRVWQHAIGWGLFVLLLAVSVGIQLLLTWRAEEERSVRVAELRSEADDRAVRSPSALAGAHVCKSVARLHTNVASSHGVCARSHACRLIACQYMHLKRFFGFLSAGHALGLPLPPG